MVQFFVVYSQLKIGQPAAVVQRTAVSHVKIYKYSKIQLNDVFSRIFLRMPGAGRGVIIVIIMLWA